MGLINVGWHASTTPCALFIRDKVGTVFLKEENKSKLWEGISRMTYSEIVPFPLLQLKYYEQDST